MTAQKANQRRLSKEAWKRMNYNNIQNTFRDNIRHEYQNSGLPKYAEDKEKNGYTIRENGWKYAFLSSEWKSAHYLGKNNEPDINFRINCLTGSEQSYFSLFVSNAIVSN